MMLNVSKKMAAFHGDKFRRMLPGYIAAILLTACLVFAYGDVFTKIIKTDAASDGFHSLIVAGMSSYIVWRKREKISMLNIHPGFWGGSFITFLGCTMLVAGKLSYTPLLKEISFVPTLFGIVWLCLGSGYLRELWFPIICLILMFPFVGEIFGGFSIYLQHLAAWIAANVLNLAGMTVLLEGQYITLPHIKLEVARVCNGANHILTLVALSILLAWTDQNSKLKRGVLILSGALIGIFANGLRVGAIGLWSSYNPNGPLHGPGDIFYVSVIFIFAFLLLFGVNLILRKWRHQAAPPTHFSGPKSESSASRRSLVASFILSIAILFGAAVYGDLWKPISVPLAKSLEEFPLRIGEWVGENKSIKDGILNFTTPDAVLRRVYWNPSGQKMELEIAYFFDQNESKKITGYQMGELHDGAKEVYVSLGARSIAVNKSEFPNGKNGKILYFCYDINGRVFSGRYAAKATSLFDAFFNKHTNGAIIAISTTKSGGEKVVDEGLILRQFLEACFPLIENWLHPSSARPSL